MLTPRLSMGQHTDTHTHTHRQYTSQAYRTHTHCTRCTHTTHTTHTPTPIPTHPYVVGDVTRTHQNDASPSANPTAPDIVVSMRKPGSVTLGLRQHINTHQHRPSQYHQLRTQNTTTYTHTQKYTKNTHVHTHIHTHTQTHTDTHTHTYTQKYTNTYTH